MDVQVLKADYANPDHAQSLINLLDAYASDPMGGGEGLSAHVRQNLVAALSDIPEAFSILAIIEGTAAGLVNCFQGFSTFACKPLINIHDVFVLDEYRGQGISLKMLGLVETIARQRDCCKLTLEVMVTNKPARSVYEKFGFTHYQLDKEDTPAHFWQKKL